MSTRNNTPTVQAHAQQPASGRKPFRRVLVRFAGDAHLTSVSADDAFIALAQKFAPNTAFAVNAALRKAASKMQKPARGEASSAVRLKAIAMLRGSYRPADARLADENNSAWDANG